MIDIGCLVVLGVVVWCVASEGTWSAGNTFLCVLLSGLLAMNFFEPLANFLDAALGGWKNYSDIIALVGLFTAFVFGLRLAAEHLTPTYIQVPPMVDQIGRWLFGALTGYVTMAFLLTALHTAPLPREFLGFKAERANFFGMSPDRQWLGFTQYVTEKSFGWDIYRIPATGNSPPQFIAQSFDSHYEALGDASSPFPNRIWPSFPIRYASRRAQIGGASTAAAAQVQVKTVTPPANGGSGASNAGF